MMSKYSFNIIAKRIQREVFFLLKPLLRRLFYYLPAKKSRICFNNFAGKGFGDNPKYIAEEIHLRDSSYQLFWLVNYMSNYEFPAYIHAVDIDSIKALYIRATSEIWISNIRNDHPVKKKESQLYLQTWHGGFGWKRVEADAQDILSREYITQAKYDGHITDGILVYGKRQEELFKRAFWLNEKTEILRFGLPKNDHLINSIKNTDKENDVIRKKLGLDEHTIYVLYAPTFRDDGSLEGYKLNFEEIIKALEKKLKKEVNVIVRLHPNVSAQSKFISYNRSIINGTFFPDAQELSVVCDCLITDYSSILYNFVLMHKPVLLCALDLQDYIDKRGLLPDFFDSPFPMAKTNEELLMLIKHFNIDEYYQKVDDYFLKNPIYDDGHAAEKTVTWLLNRVRKKN